MNDLAYYSTFYELLSKLYVIAHYLDSDGNYDRQSAVNDLLSIIHMIESDKTFFLKEGEINAK